MSNIKVKGPTWKDNAQKLAGAGVGAVGGAYATSKYVLRDKSFSNYVNNAARSVFNWAKQPFNLLTAGISSAASNIPGSLSTLANATVPATPLGLLAGATIAGYAGYKAVQALKNRQKQHIQSV